MEDSIPRRLKVFRSITGDVSPQLHQSSGSIQLDQSFSHFSNTQSLVNYSELSATLNSSVSSSFSEKPLDHPPVFQPQVASRMLKNPILQSLQQKIIDPKQNFSKAHNLPQVPSDRQDLVPGSLSSRSFLNLSTEDSSREEMQERGKPKKRPLYENEKNLYIIRLDWINSGKDTRTTVMIKNIPNKYSQKMLLHAIDKHFIGTYDFLYLPIDFKNKCNVGYAFINFWDYRVIVQFFLEFNDKRWERFNSEKICAIAYARIQGFKELVQHFENSSVINQDDNKVKPVILRRN